MIVCIGDTHGNIMKIKEVIYDQNLKKDDYLIVAGDFGFVFRGDARESKMLEQLERLEVNICFVDGNHESFYLLNKYDRVRWKGGMVHQIGRNVYHLMRGQVFLIEGKKIFTMGGAASKDKRNRIDEVNWWSQEIPNKSEYEEAIINLESHNYEVDYVITHQAPKRIILEMGKTIFPDEIELVNFLDMLSNNIKYRKWYFGHWHLDDEKSERRFHAIYLRPIIIF